MLRHTLILPESDGDLALKLLKGLVQDKRIILFVVLDPVDADFVEKADTRAEGFASMRHVVWTRNPKLPELAEAVSKWTGGDASVVAVTLTFDGRVADRITENEPRTFRRVERAYLKAQEGGA